MRAVVFVVIVLALSACKAPVQQNGIATYAKWQAINLGQSYDQVCSIMGTTGREIDIREFLPADYAFEPNGEVCYQWPGRGLRGSSVSAMFKNDQLLGVTYVGLEVPGRKDKRPSVGSLSTYRFLNFER